MARCHRKILPCLALPWSDLNQSVTSPYPCLSLSSSLSSARRLRSCHRPQRQLALSSEPLQLLEVAGIVTLPSREARTSKGRGRKALPHTPHLSDERAGAAFFNAR
jgi:hypothetical protein